MFDYMLLTAFVGVPVAYILFRFVAMIALGYEIGAALWSMPIG